MKSMRDLSVIWGVNSDGEDWLFFVKALEFSRKDVIASMLSLVPRRSGRYSVCNTLHRTV